MNILKAAVNQEKGLVKERFILAHYLDLFPNSTSIIPRLLSSPNFILCAIDINRAKEFILANKGTLLQYQKYMDEQQRENQRPQWQQHKIPSPISLSNEEIGNLKINYAYWSAIMLYARIINSSEADKKELVETMIKNWGLVTIALSLRQGFIVGWRYNHWVDFATNLKTKTPGFVPLFLSECIKHNYNLKSKKADHLHELTKFVNTHHPKLPDDIARLFSVIFPVIGAV